MTITDRSRALQILESLRNDWNISDAQILDHIIGSWMTGHAAEKAMIDTCDEFDIVPFGIDQEDEDME